MKDINAIKDRKNNKLKMAQRADLIESHLKAIFVNQKVHIFSSLCSIKGTCVDITGGDYCLTNASYEVFSTQDVITSKGTSNYMMVPRSGKIVAILEN